MSKFTKSLFLILITICFSCNKPNKKLTIPYDQLLTESIYQYYGDSIGQKYLIWVKDSVGTNLDLAINGLLKTLDFQDCVNDLNQFFVEYSIFKDSEVINRMNSVNSFEIGTDFTKDAVGFFRVTEPYWVNENKVWIYFEIFCGKKCGSGVLYTLEKSQSFWIKANEIEVWGGTF